jgi:hypothetical protein
MDRNQKQVDSNEYFDYPPAIVAFVFNWRMILWRIQIKTSVGT